MMKLLIDKASSKIKKSINIKLSLWVALSLVISMTIGILIVEVVKPLHFINVKHIDYDKDRYDTEGQVLDFIDGLYSEGEDKDQYIKNNISSFKGNIYIIDKNGKVQYKNINDGYEMVDVIDITSLRKEIEEGDKRVYRTMYPLTINNDICYFIMIKNLDGEVLYSYEVTYIIAVITSLVVFIIMIYLGIKRKVKYIEYISSSLEEISRGNLKYTIKENGEDELAMVASNINEMKKSLIGIIEKEKENDKKQRELITNISHDLKTPLTIILGYLDIIKTKKYKSDEEKERYIEVTYEKAVGLQQMILKLFDLVKLADKETVLDRRKVNINRLLRQVILEYFPIAEGKNIIIEYNAPEDTIILEVDLDKMCIVFDNLISNAVKYSKENEKVIVTLEHDDAGVLIHFKNKCINVNKDDLSNLFNRFYRGDKARNSSIEGSGIGLSIAKRIIELHNSNIWAELEDDEISFIIRLRG